MRCPCIGRLSNACVRVLCPSGECYRRARATCVCETCAKDRPGDSMSALPDSSRGAAANDADAGETREWLDALSAVIASEGGERAHFLLEQLIDEARQAGIDVPLSANTAYVNTIPTDQEERTPGNIEIEERLRAYMRWNAMAMVVKAN